MGEIVGAGFATTRAMLMGRQLYSEWSEYWPANADGNEFGEVINNMPKYVVSDSRALSTGVLSLTYLPDENPPEPTLPGE